MCVTKKMSACITLMVLAVVLVGCSLDGGTGTGSGNGGNLTACGPSSIDFQSGQTYQLNGTTYALGGKTQLTTPYGHLEIRDGCQVGKGIENVYVRVYCDGQQITNYVGIPIAYGLIPVNAQTKRCEPYPPAPPVCYMTIWIGWPWQGFVKSDRGNWFDPPPFPKGT